MTALLHTPARRIALAAALSILVHALLLWLPEISLPRNEILLPPLAAKLEAPPKLARRPLPAHKPPPVQPPKPAVKHEPDPLPASAVAPAVEPVSAVEPAPSVSASAETPAENQAVHPLPKRAQLTFQVYMGADRIRIGTVRQHLEIDGNTYVLKALTETAGLARMFKNYQLTQVSRGKLGPQGLVPDEFDEEKINDGEKEHVKATFDWTSGNILFSSGGSAALQPGVQDMLSIFYNLSQLPINSNVITLSVSNGRKLEKYDFEVVPDEEIVTSMGKLKSVHLTKLHAKGESGFEIWLGLEYRLLPVKYRLVEPSGEVSGEIVISDIRVSDE